MRRGLSSRRSAMRSWGRGRRSAHDPGGVLTDLAVMLADGGEAISDLAVLRDQPLEVFAVASRPTARQLPGSRRRGRSGGVADCARAWNGGGCVRGERLGVAVGNRCWGTDSRVVIDGCYPGDDAFGEGTDGRELQGRSATTRCWRFWTTLAKRWLGCCARVTPIKHGRRPCGSHRCRAGADPRRRTSRPTDTGPRRWCRRVEGVAVAPAPATHRTRS